MLLGRLLLWQLLLLASVTVVLVVAAAEVNIHRLWLLMLGWQWLLLRL